LGTKNKIIGERKRLDRNSVFATQPVCLDRQLLTAEDAKELVRRWAKRPGLRERLLQQVAEKRQVSQAA
jgi:hypothetical protein